MSKHTPGPWQTLTFSNHELQTDFAMVAIGKRAHIVGYNEEDCANARLIAAAPDLLAALEMSLKEMEKDWMRLDGEFGPYMEEFGDIEGAIREKHRTTKTIRMAIEAIAKVKG